MLYQRWRDVAREKADQFALRDTLTGRQWTFRELAAAAEHGADKDAIFYPRGINSEFIITVLRAWRLGRIVCPLEHDQETPDPGSGLPSNIIHLKTTSATTGAARMIAFTGKQLAADADNIVATMGLRTDWPNLGAISLAHSYGFSNLVLPLLLHGIPLILVGAPLPEMLRRAAASENALTLAAVPALWRAWHNADAIPANVRLAISAGAPLPLPLEQSVFTRDHLKIHNFYGSSECGGIAYDSSEVPRVDPTFVGTALKNVKVLINEDACIEVSSEAVAATYWPDPSPALVHGTFQSGDLAQVVSNRVYLRGRLGDLINVAGRKLAPETVEKVLLTHPAVSECLVFGAPIVDERSEIIVACVVSDVEVSGEKLRQYLLGKLPAWQVPREWWRVDSLAANQRGKVPRSEWRRRFIEVTAQSENMP